MTRITTVLFDFDGVVTNTEPQYDAYLDALGEEYNLGLESLAALVKGMTSNNMLEKYFSHLSDSDLQILTERLEDFERQMDFPPVDGAIETIHQLKKDGYKIGLVTSSQSFKMKIALEELNLTNVFDVEITADHITIGKPDPMCYLLAAEKLGSLANECLVLEDSLFGIAAGNAAGMKVVGLSTTNPVELLEDKCVKVIPDFRNFDISEINQL